MSHLKPSLTARVAAVLAALVAGLSLSSCSSPASTNPTPSDTPLVTGEPAGSNADDEAFANNMIENHRQGIDLSAWAADRSTDPEIIAFAAENSAALQSDVRILEVLLVQWTENPDTKTGTHGDGAATKGLVDQATIARLESLQDNQFDTLWLRSMISLHEGAIEMANDEIANGKNVDAIVVAKQIVDARQAQITQMKQMLGG